MSSPLSSVLSDESLEAVLDRTVQTVMNRQEIDWHRQDTGRVLAGRSKKRRTVRGLHSPAAWLKIKRDLGRVPLTIRAKLRAFSPRRLWLDLLSLVQVPE